VRLHIGYFLQLRESSRNNMKIQYCQPLQRDLRMMMFRYVTMFNSPHSRRIFDRKKVRLAAMEAFASFFRSISKKSQQKYYALIPEVLNILPPIKEKQESEELTRALVSLIDLAEVAPKMFKPLFHNLVAFAISVIQDKELTDQARQNALELMATFADYAPTMVKKDQSYTKDMITQCLSLMTDIGVDDDDAAEWNASDDVRFSQKRFQYLN